VEGAVAIAAGDSHAAALLENGTVVSWGSNSYGQTNTSTITNVVAITGGNTFTLLLKNDGTTGLIGRSIYSLTAPTGATNLLEIGAGRDCCVVLRRDGQLFSWGAPSANVFQIPTNIFNPELLAVGLGSENSAYSSAAVMTRNPLISIQPTGQTLSVGQDTVLQAAACGTSPLFYQWKYKGAALANATNASLYLPDVQPEQAGTYLLVVSNRFGSIQSTTAMLTVQSPPEIVSQPAYALVQLG
jgi:hypothetical protein